jgi:hypothetical protein
MIRWIHKVLLWAVIWISFCPFEALGQAEKIYISGTFNNVSFEEFVKIIEDQHPIRVFYNHDWVDSIVVNRVFNHDNLKDVFLLILKNTTVNYHYYHGSVFLTDHYVLKTDFFNKDNLISNYKYDTTITKSYYTQIHFKDEIPDEKNGDYLLKTIELGRQNARPGINTATISGTIKDNKTGETLPGVTIFISELNIGTSTNEYGYYTINLPIGEHKLIIQSVGMKKVELDVMIYGDDILDYELSEEIIPLKEVVIESEKTQNIIGLETGLDRLDIKTMKELPTNMGEVDVMRIALALPGVQSSGEAASGFNVRGGTADQNLILLDKAIIYNTSHLFGFFSVFNPDIIKNTDLYKGSIPANHGGRISSVFSISTKNGNMKKLAGSGGISPVTARLSFEGPIKKDKTTFILGFRSTYSDWLLNQIQNDLFDNSKASFYDFNASLNHTLNKNNSLTLSYYQSYDDFQLNADTVYKYTNRTASIQWMHMFNQKFLAVISGIYSGYKYQISSYNEPTQAFDLGFDINQFNIKSDFNYYTDSNHELNFGLDAQYFKLNPGYIYPGDSASLVRSNQMDYENALDYAFYVSDEFEINPKLSIYAGLRYLVYHKLGPQNSILYQDNLPKDENTMIDTVAYKNGDIVKTYHGPELRISLNYLLDMRKSLKFSFTQTRQVLHMLTNSIAISPTDVWKLSDEYIPPSNAWQLSCGYYQNMWNNTVEGSLEAYIKKSRNVLDYKSGAKLILNEHIETDILNAEGLSYGIELFLKKNFGKFNGWFSYSFSRSFLRTTSKFSEENVSEGAYYPSYVDRPHDLSIIANYKFTRRFSISSSLFYNTGRPITLPVSKFSFADKTRFYYSDRNDYRLPDYFRIDLSLKLEGNHKIKKLAHSSWIFSIYNLTGRDNVYSVYFVSSKEQIRGYKISIFNNPVPTLTYNFRF